MAFSINYGKQFAVFERFSQDDPINQNSRIYNLADKLDLNNRIISKNSKIENILNQIDYSNVRLKLDSLISESLQYLKDSLSIK